MVLQLVNARSRARYSRQSGTCVLWVAIGSSGGWWTSGWDGEAQGKRKEDREYRTRTLRGREGGIHSRPVEKSKGRWVRVKAGGTKRVVGRGVLMNQFKCMRWSVGLWALFFFFCGLFRRRPATFTHDRPCHTTHVTSYDPRTSALLYSTTFPSPAASLKLPLVRWPHRQFYLFAFSGLQFYTSSVPFVLSFIPN